MATVTRRTELEFTATDRASSVLRALGGGVDRLESSFSSLSLPLLRVQSLLATFTGGALVAGITSLVNSIDDLDEAAQGLGVTAVELANLRASAVDAGVGAEKLDAALSKLNTDISEGAAGSKEQVALFGALGISLRDAAGNVRPTTAVLGELADIFAKLEEGPAKTALAVDLFGQKLGRTLVPFLNQGAEGMQKFAGLTEETVKQANRLQNELDKLNLEWERLKFALADGVIPVINALSAALKDLTSSAAWARFAAGFVAGGPANAIAQSVLYLTRATGEAKKASELRDRAVAEGLKLSGAEAAQSGRSAQAIRDKAAADLAAANAAKAKAKATEESSNAYAKEFADVSRIRAARKAFDQEQEDSANRERDRRAQRIQDLTGQSAVKQQTEDVKALDDAFFQGSISIEQYDVALRKVFGTNSEVEDGMKRQTDIVEQLGLTMASSIGDLITAGGRAGDVWKALGQDILKIITQLLIIKPLALELQKVFKDLNIGGGSGGSGSGLLSQLLQGAAGAIGGLFTGAGTGTGQNANGSWGLVDVGAASAGATSARATAASITVNNYIDGAVDRARIASYVETGVKSGLAASWDNVARGGTGVLVG